MFTNGRFFLFSVLVSCLSMFSGCGGSNQPTNPIQAEEIKSVYEKQQTYVADLETLIQSKGVETAKQEMAQTISADSLVAWAEVSEQGVMIQYKNGGRSVLETDLEFGDPNDPPITAKTIEIEPVAKTFGPAKVSPKAPKAIFFNSIYTEFNGLFNATRAGHGTLKYYDRLSEDFQAIGTNIEAKYLDGNVTVDLFKNLDGYNIIHLTGHGIRFKIPETDKSEIYYLTGQEAKVTDIFDSSKEELSDAWMAGEIIITTRKPGKYNAGKSFYCVGPDYMTKNLDLSQEKAFVMLEFCRSGLGTWQEKLSNKAKVDVCLAWDNVVSGRRTVNFLERIYEKMCDIRFNEAYTLEDALIAVDPSYVNTKNNGTPNDPSDDITVTVTLNDFGNVKHAFWEYVPGDPSILGSLEMDSAPRSVAVVGSTGYVACADTNVALRIVELGGTTPSLLGSANFTTHSTGRGVFVVGNYAYLGSGGFYIVNVSNTASLIKTARYGLNADCGDLIVSGNYAYMAAGKYSYSNKGLFAVLDTTEPENMDKNRSIGGLEIPDANIRAIAISGKYAFVLDTMYGYMYTIDISDPTKPVKAAETKIHASDNIYCGITIVGNMAYIAMSGFAIVDISNPLAPVVKYEEGGYENDIAVLNGRAYLVGSDPNGEGKGKLLVLNVTDPTKPELATQIELPGPGVSITISGQRAYIGQTLSTGKGLLSTVNLIGN